MHHNRHHATARKWPWTVLVSHRDKEAIVARARVPIYLCVFHLYKRQSCRPGNGTRCDFFIATIKVARARTAICNCVFYLGSAIVAATKIARARNQQHHTQDTLQVAHLPYCGRQMTSQQYRNNCTGIYVYLPQQTIRIDTGQTGHQHVVKWR